MNWKPIMQFFKPDWIKLGLLFAVLFVSVSLGPLAVYISQLPSSELNNDLLYIFYPLAYLAVVTQNFYFPVFNIYTLMYSGIYVIDLFFFYFISCMVTWIIDKVRNPGKARKPRRR